MNFKNVLYMLLTLFFLSIGALVYLLKKPICIDSRLVEKIDRVTIEGTKSTYRCSISKSVPYDEVFIEKNPIISRKLFDLERFFEETSSLKNRVEIIWLDTSTGISKVQDHKIYISTEMLFKDFELEKNMIHIWLREKAYDKAIDKSLLETSLTNLILFSMGKYQSDKNLSDLKWPFFVSTSSENEKLFLNSSMVDFSTLSLINSWEQLSLSERTRLLKMIPSFLKSLDSIQVSTMLSVDQSSDSLSKLKLELQKNLKLLSALNFEKLNQNLNKLYDQNNLFNLSNVAKLDSLVILGTDLQLDSKLQDNLINSVQKANQLTGLMQDKKIWFLPSKESLVTNDFDKIEARNLIYLTCEMPNQHKINELYNLGEKLLIVKKCEELSNLKLKSFFKIGYEGFAEDNPGVSFIQIHLPSLRQALKDKIEIPFVSLQEKNFSGPFFQAVGWQSPEIDPILKIYKTQSVIQAIEAFRVSN